MALVAETALLGGQHPLHDEISALAIAVASPETPEKIGLARKALAERSNEHALLDAAGIIGFFCHDHHTGGLHRAFLARVCQDVSEDGQDHCHRSEDTMHDRQVLGLVG